MVKLNFAKELDNGKNRVYGIELDEAKVTVSYGLEGGVIKDNSKTHEAKYVGKINEMSADVKASEVVLKKHDELIEKGYALVDGDIDVVLDAVEDHKNSVDDLKSARDEAKAEAKAKKEAAKDAEKAEADAEEDEDTEVA